MKTLKLLLLLLICGTVNLQAQKVDTIQVYSKAMKKEIPNLVILPEGYPFQKGERYPVVYLLHGYGGQFSTWYQKTKPNLPQVASQLNLIIVCPDGEKSWYWDSPENPALRFETYISQELISYIDRHYNTRASREGRAITGFSMGGHGGLWLGFRHPDLFGACGSTSGGVDIRPFPNNWDMKKSLGSYAKYPERWEKHTVINQLPYDDQYGPLAIIIDCGSGDFFYEVNEALHQKLLYLNIPHDYIIRPGKHTHEYWNNSIDYQLLFFHKLFRNTAAQK